MYQVSTVAKWDPWLLGNFPNFQFMVITSRRMPLRRSKSLFGTDKLEEGYLDPISLRKAHLVTSAMDDDDEDEDGENDENKHNAQVGILGGENPEGSEASSPTCKGGPFSALTPSMWPSKGNKAIRNTRLSYQST